MNISYTSSAGRARVGGVSRWDANSKEIEETAPRRSDRFAQLVATARREYFEFPADGDEEVRTSRGRVKKGIKG